MTRSFPFPCVGESGSIHFRIGVIADQDEKSKVDDKTWQSWLRTGTLTYHKDKKVSVKWDPGIVELFSHISEKGRGVELSELVAFNGRLYTVDDRSGIGEQGRGGEGGGGVVVSGRFTCIWSGIGEQGRGETLKL